jgi:hypothetical protein
VTTNHLGCGDHACGAGMNGKVVQKPGVFGSISVENDTNVDLDRTSEETLNYEVPDDALGVVAGL